MSNHNNELISVNDINTAIEDFIGKHPENVTIWVDGKTVTIQISNVGVRDKLFPRLAYLVENTVIENNLQLFDMPAKCVYASDRIVRFTCTINELVSSVEEYNIPSSPAEANEDEEWDPRWGPISQLGLHETPTKKFYKRIMRSNVFKRLQSILNKKSDSSKISVYVISNPEAHDTDENGNPCNYVTWEVIGILDVEAGTIWNDYNFKERLNKLKQSKNINYNCGEYGTFNVDFIGSINGDNDIIKDEKYIGRRPEFIMDSSVKVGDIIDSRNYTNRELWNNGFNYQTSSDEYQTVRSFYTAHPQLKGIDFTMYGETLIPDGAIITI